MNKNLQECCVEFVGTFFLVLTVGCVVLMGNPGVIPAIAIGFALMIMVYAGGHISGGHYNPAVTLAAVIRGACSAKKIAHYWVSQLLGSGAACFMVAKLIPYINKIPNDSFNPKTLLVGEFLFTFALCYVVLLTATTKNTEGNSYFGLAIGSTVTVGAFAVGGICLAAFNPAVALGAGLLHMAPWNIVGMTAVINLAAGAVAAGIFHLVESESEK